MQSVLSILMLIVGFALLIKGADWFVDGSSSIAKTLKIPSILVGLTIVSMGTSAPELAVSASAGLKGANEIAISNVVGSNLFNLLVVLGLCAMIKPLPVLPSIRFKTFPYQTLITLLLMLLVADVYLPWLSIFKGIQASYKLNQVVGVLGRTDSVILLILFGAFLYTTISGALKGRSKSQESESVKLGFWASVIYIVVGIAGIVVGGNLVVDNASSLAKELGMSQTLVGLTIVAVGTSLPELVTSVVASRKGETEIAVGNVVGSNIFNILFILGVSSGIHPIIVTMASLIDIGVLILTGLYTYALLLTRKSISKLEGLSLLVIYGIYTIYIINR
jgi:cation:H+ antiporter